eukprot:CAMPEP_0183702908 /NCGR_PEP_ID=MMETSP0737-20130205/849_1 /TAXON_ID=385413 /ORGANISM="Thalassiosira miniscula, Strain CCMP1093" /LENGTH=530 /DNA_ID=CAMNT_0025929591 /DNA_START=129 /DNA_END=1721 /DNA_ORIENTATION=-
MSQMDLSQRALESDDDSFPGDDNRDDSGVGTSIGLDPVGIHVSTTSTAVEDEFVDALEHLPHAHHSNGSSSSSAVAPRPAAHSNESNYGILERCGRWLMSIPRDDVVALQQTSEYRDFLAAFDKLGEAHRRTVTLERQSLLMERDDSETMAECSTNDNISSLAGFSTSNHNLHLSSSQERSPSTNINNDNNTRISSPIDTTISMPHPPPLLSPTSASRRRRYSFLQHLAVDDVLLRIFEFIDCYSLVRTGTTCHRFRELSTRSAEQRTQRLADGRLLRSAMKMLRAQEQIEGVGPREESGPFVPIPMLGLRRRIKVSGAGDPEYNGIYFCTGSNGNGFLFTKPRGPEQRVRIPMDPPTLDLQQLMELDGVMGGIEEPPPLGDGNENPFVVDGADGHDPPAENDDNVEAVGNIHAGVNHQVVANQQGNDAVDVLFGDEPNRSRLLRCVIAKRFSNETILWYMSKEVVDETSQEISQNFSFWAKLLVTGDATPDVCQYPSQTSILSRNGDPAWQPLTNTVDVMPPIVELLDN